MSFYYFSLIKYITVKNNVYFIFIINNDSRIIILFTFSVMTAISLTVAFNSSLGRLDC